MARVKFIRDEEPNIRSLETNGGAIDGALYVATDTGNMWMGTDKVLAGSGNNALLKINGNQVTVFNLVVSTSNNSINITSQLTYNEIVSDIKAGYEVFARIRPSEDENDNNCYVKINLLNGTLRSDLIPIKMLYSGSTATETPLFVPCYLHCTFSNQWEIHSNNPWASVGFQTFSNSSFTNTNTNGLYTLDIKDKSISTDKLADASVTKAKLGSDIVIPTTKADIGLENVDNTADANKSVKYATSAGSANTASVANSVAWDNVTGAPTIPDVSDYVKHEAINEYTAPDNKLNVELISGLDEYISNNINYPEATEATFGGVYASVNSSMPSITPLGHVYSQKSEGLIISNINNGAISSNHLADGAITTAKIINGAVTKAKLGADVPVIYSSTSEPTSTDGKDGDVWIVYEV